MGRWKDETTLEFHWEDVYEGKQSSEDVTFSWVSDNEVHVHEVDITEGKLESIFDYILKK